MGKATQSQIIELNGALAVIILKEVLADSNFKVGDSVNVYTQGSKIVIADPAQPHYTLDELLDGITDENRHAEIDWGPPVGREVW